MNDLLRYDRPVDDCVVVDNAILSWSCDSTICNSIQYSSQSLRKTIRQLTALSMIEITVTVFTDRISRERKSVGSE